MYSNRRKKVAKQLQELAADFFKKTSSKTALMTITRAEISPDFKNATIFFTVFPEDKEHSALAFAKRRGGDFREYVKNKLSMRVIPFFEFEIDKGEKNFYKMIEILK